MASNATKESKGQVQLNSEELKDFLKHIVFNNRALQAKKMIPVAVNIEGDSGVGKTSCILQLAKELGLHMVRLNLAEIEELGDLVGFPIKEFEVTKDGVSKWVTEATIPQYINQSYKPTGESKMSHAAPDFIHGVQKGGILLLDDYTRADSRFMQATMTLIETQEYMSWKLPEDWHIILTTNPDNGHYNVTSLDGAQKTRFATVHYKFDVEVWARWAEKQDVDTRCINFLLMHPELITRDVNPRSVMTFFNSISSIPDFEKALGLIQMIGEGSVGPEFAIMFNTFINNRLDRLISPKEMLLNPNENYIIGEVRKATGTGSTFRADIGSTLVTRLINYTTIYSDNNPIEQPIIDRLIKLSTDADTFTDDLKYLIVKKVFNHNKQKFQKMMNNTQVMNMAIK
jgi:hypothetical protein